MADAESVADACGKGDDEGLEAQHTIPRAVDEVVGQSRVGAAASVDVPLQQLRSEAAGCGRRRIVVLQRFVRLS